MNFLAYGNMSYYDPFLCTKSINSGASALSSQKFRLIISIPIHNDFPLSSVLNLQQFYLVNKSLKLTERINVNMLANRLN